MGVLGLLILAAAPAARAHRVRPACPPASLPPAPTVNPTASTAACEQPVRAVHASSPPVIDGHLDDAVWQLAPALDGFRQREPVPGAPATEATEVRLLFDDRALYLAWRLRDREPRRVRAVAGRKDAMPESDQVALFLDPFHDHRTGFVFAVNAAGVVADGALLNESEIDWNWDGVWQAAARLTGEGWVVEMALPWSTLRWRREERPSWGIHLRRYLSRRSETDEHAVIPVASGRLASRFAHLEGLAPLPEGFRLQLVPYLGLRFQARFAESSATRRDWFRIRGGLDLRAALGASLTLDATVLPDFGQVEVDPTVVTLDPYEVMFPEKRPFFLQGQDHFRTPYSILHTRRIGAPPPAPEVTEREQVDWRDDEAPIWAAGKLTGRRGKNAVGVLSALVGETEAGLRDPAGQQRTVRTTPLAHYGALSLRRQLRGSSSTGLLATGVSRLDGPDAYVGSLDLDLRGSGPHSFTLQAVGSAADVGLTERLGWAALGAGGRTAGEPWRWYAEAYAFSREVDWNDAGYLRRPDYLGGTLWVDRSRTIPAGWLRKYSFNLGTAHQWNFDGYDLGHVLWLSSWLRGRSLWEGSLEVGGHAPRWDDRELRGGPPLRRPWRGYTAWNLLSDSSRPLAGSLSGNVALDRESYAVDATLKLVIATRLLTLEGALYGLAHRGRPRWAETRTGPDGDQAILADLDQDLVEAKLSSTVLLYHGLTLQAFVQWMVAVERRAAWQRVTAADEMAPVAPGAPSHSLAALRAQVVLRWEYRPGSTLFVTYRHDGAAEGPEGRFLPLSALGTAIHAPAEDLFLIKLSYLWGR